MTMRRIVISLPDALYTELAEVSSGCSPAMWATEAVESALASRRLPNVKAGRNGARVISGIEEEAEPEPYRVHWPQAES